MSNLGIVKRPKRGTKAFDIIRLLEEMIPQDEVDIDHPQGCMFLPVAGPEAARELRSLWHTVVHQHTLSAIGTKLIKWPNGDYELLIWRKT